MGSGVSTTDPIHKFAYLVVKEEYERLKILIERDNIEITDEILYNILQQIYNVALLEYHLSFIDCTNSSVLCTKYNQLTDNEKLNYEVELMDAINVKEKKLKIINDLKEKQKGNYDKSTSGTADDTKNEQEAAKLLRGNDNNDNNNDPIILTSKIKKFIHPILEKSFHITGKWKKFLGLSKNCYIYIHILSKIIVSIKPEEYNDDENNNNNNMEQLIDPRILNPSNNLQICTIYNLIDEIDKLIVEEKTPLLIDTSQEQFLATYFTYKAILLDASVLIIPYAKGGIKRETLIEDARKKLVLAIKTGVTFVLYLGQCTIEHADWKTKLCKKDVFPTDIFQQGGLKLKGPAHSPRYKVLFKPDELEHGQAIMKDGFRVVVLSSLSPYDYEEKLSASIPLGYMKPIYVQKE